MTDNDPGTPDDGADDAGRDGPLTGIRVLDLTAVVLGPVATQILGDYGAEVVKVETLAGDLMRANGVSRVRGLSSIFQAINRNKRSIAVDLKSADGLAVVRRLIADCDVLVHNMRPAAIERLGLGYDAVRAIRPDIVYCAAPGFGQDGPHRDRPAFDDIIQAACGLVAVNAEAAGRPVFTPSLIADKTTGLAVVHSVLAALVFRARHGRGQYVEVPMLETMTAFLLAEHLGGLSFTPAEGPAGYARVLKGGREPAPTSDGWICMLPYTGEQWRRFFDEAGRGDLIARFDVDDRHARNRQVQALYAELRGLTRTRTTAHWMTVCERLDIPATPIYSLDALPDHPHLQAVGLFVDSVHPADGPVRQVRPPTRFAATPATLRRHAPTLGQHTREVLREAGYDEAQIDRMIAAGAIGAAAPAPQAPPEREPR